MSGFSVRPEVVRSISKDMSTMADAVDRARLATFAFVHFSGGGSVLSDLGESAAEMRGVLLANYGHSGPAYQAFEGAAAALHQMADDYKTVDRESAAKLDSVMETSGGSSEEYPGGNPNIDYANYMFVTDHNDAFAGFSQLMKWSDNVEYVVGLDWISSFATAAGLADPLKPIRDRLEGDWKQLSPVIGALHNLVRFWESAGYDVQQVPVKLIGNWIEPPAGAPMGPFLQYNAEYNGEANWSGNAADATGEWLGDVSQACYNHATAISMRVDSLQLRMQAMYEGMDILLDTLQDVIEILPSGQSFDDWILDFVLPWKQASRLAHLASAMMKLMTRVDAVVVLAQEALGIFIGLVGDLHTLEFPTMTFHAPDVNG
jgi:hypothetical protein